MEIVSVDTCVVIRLLTKDNLEQYRASYSLFAKKQIFIPNTVILETHWVLKAAYNYTREQICNDLRWLCGLPNVTLGNETLIAETIKWYESGLDFADALHLAKSQQYSVFCTFDKSLIKKGKSINSCRIEQP